MSPEALYSTTYIKLYINIVKILSIVNARYSGVNRVRVLANIVSFIFA